MAGFFRRVLGGRLGRASAATGHGTGPTTESAAGPGAASTTAGHSPSPGPGAGTGSPTGSVTGLAVASQPAIAAGQPAEGTAAGSATASSSGALLIFGQVRERPDNPLDGATVTLTDLSGRQLDRDRADSGGHYRLRPPAGGNYLVICASEAHQPTAVLVPVADSPVRHDVILSAAGASLSGTVRLAESGQPLTNAVVTLVDIQGNVAGAAGTDAKGWFSFVELAQGHYTLTVAAESLQPVARGVEIPADGHVTVDVEVAERVQLAGVVRTGTAGVVVPEALATLIAADGQVVGSVITDAEGRFVFDDLAVGVYTLIASGYPPAAAEVTVGMGAPNETMISLWPPTLESPVVAMAGSDAAGDRFGREGSDDGN